MRIKLQCCFQELCNWLRKILADKCGNFPFGDVKPESKRSAEPIEREIVINNTKIHIKSIFTEKTSLDRAMKNIVARKISDSKADQ